MAQTTPNNTENKIAINIRKIDPMIAFLTPPSLPKDIPSGFLKIKSKFTLPIPLDIIK